MTEILYASRSWSNECKGKDMFSCIARDGVVVCYFPTKSASDKYAAAMQLAACTLAEAQPLNPNAAVKQPYPRGRWT